MPDDLQQQIEVLEAWHRQHGGYLHPCLKLSHTRESGLHWRATGPLEPQTLVLSVPHSLALSYLNALVDEKYPFFKQRRHDFGGIEAIGFWYLMIQYLRRDQSFWKPYLDTLPTPESELSTPLFFEDEDDLAWLESTDVLHSATQRLDVYEKQYRLGLEILNSAGLETDEYTWQLYKWAVTMFTSRSFSSRSIRPADSKYWTTFRSGPDGRRQTVLLDMSGVSAEDLDFPVLFPTMDAGNHDPRAPVDWAYDPGRFSVTVRSRYDAGQEVFNNYSTSKSNGELLLGYGFCLPDNPADVVMLTLKAPPRELQDSLRNVHPGYFLKSGEWDGDKATFYLTRAATSESDVATVMSRLPEPLLELLLYMLRHERGLTFTFVENPYDFLTTPGSAGTRYLPHIARAIVQSLMPKLQNLQAITLPDQPQNQKQRQAAVYRDAQIKILSGTIQALRTFTRSFLHSRVPNGPRLCKLEDLFQIWSQHTSEAVARQYLDGIAASAGTADFGELISTGWEDDVTVLLLCSMVLEGSKTGVLDLWLENVVPEYIDRSVIMGVLETSDDSPDDDTSPAYELYNIMQHAAASTQENPSLWKDSRWSANFIAEVGGKILQFDSMKMMVPLNTESNAGEVPRVVVYLHTI